MLSAAVMRASLICALMLICACSLHASGAASAGTPPANGPQVARGAEVYAMLCVGCHSQSLSGGKGPALRGAQFWSNWDQKPARSLYSRILTTMPPTEPGTMSDREVLDVMAFILERNGVAVAPAETPESLNGQKLTK